MKFTILVISVMFMFTSCAVNIHFDDADQPASEELVEPKEPSEPIDPAQGVVPKVPSVKMVVAPDIPAKIDSLKENDTTFMEVVVTQDSPLIGRMRRYLRRKTSNRMTLMAVARHNEPIHKRLGKIIFQIGDVLLLQGSEDELKSNINQLELLPLARREIELGIFSKIGFALAVFIGSILLSMLGFFPTTVSFIGAILIYILSGLLKPKDLYNNYKQIFFY